MLVYNSYASPNLADLVHLNYCFAERLISVQNLNLSLKCQLQALTHKQAYEILQKKLRYFRQAVQKFVETRQNLLNRDKMENNKDVLIFRSMSHVHEFLVSSSGIDSTSSVNDKSLDLLFDNHFISLDADKYYILFTDNRDYRAKVST